MKTLCRTHSLSESDVQEAFMSQQDETAHYVKRRTADFSDQCVPQPSWCTLQSKTAPRRYPAAKVVYISQIYPAGKLHKPSGPSYLYITNIFGEETTTNAKLQGGANESTALRTNYFVRVGRKVRTRSGSLWFRSWFFMKSPTWQKACRVLSKGWWSLNFSHNN